VGGVCALANVLPAPLTSLYDQFAADGWTPELQRRQTSLIEANAIVTRGLGTVMVVSMTWQGSPRSSTSWTSLGIGRALLGRP